MRGRPSIARIEIRFDRNVAVPLIGMISSKCTQGHTAIDQQSEVCLQPISSANS